MAKPQSQKHRYTWQITVLSILCICVLMVFLCFQYYNRLQETIQKESSGYLQEISRLLGDNVSRIIEDNFSVLGTVSTAIKSAGVSSYTQLQPIVQDQKKYWNYKNLFLVDGNGVAYDANGQSTVLGDEDFLRQALLEKTPAMSSTLVLDDRDSVVFAIPVKGLTMDGTEIGALAASYDLSTFDQILSMTAFKGEAYAHIIRRDGTVVIRSSSKNATATGYNILNVFDRAETGSGSSVEAMKADILSGKDGMMQYTLDGVRKHMAYTPLAAQDWYLITFVPVSVVSAQSELMLRVTLLLCGIIALAFSALITFLAIAFYRHKRSLEKLAYVDPVTGGNTIQRFNEDAQTLLAKTSLQQPYAMVYLNIEKFKLLNEQYGRKTCDELLRSIHCGIAPDLAPEECMGRLSADNFCFLLRFTNDDDMRDRLVRWRQEAVNYSTAANALWLPHNMEFGIFVIDNCELPLTQMIDRAKLSLSEATSVTVGKVRCCIYDEKVRRILIREKQLEDRMEEALANGEFEVYLQPKYSAKTEQIGGAEALVRWRSPEEGMIFPDEFIPLFERNGFVVPLDLFVFEEVCRKLEEWHKAGRPPLKVSVNCSRTHLRMPGFLNRYRQVAEKYELPPGVLELELTESAVFEDVQALSGIIHAIHDMGFGCSMDDFGSGYSSLNLIRDIPVDTIKLDKIFFRSSAVDAERTESVVGSIITMAQALHMMMVAEGVEERPQVEMLQRLGCDLIQGYYYSKPIPIPQFERLLDAEMAEAGE